MIGPLRALLRRGGEAPEAAPAPTPRRGGTRGVVLLEDDQTISALVIEGLEDNGFHVAATAHPADALAAVEQAGGRVVLIADRSIDRTGPNGFQVAEEALSRHPELRVVYVSGTHLAIRHRALGKRERALFKPFAIAQLVAVVRELAG